MPKTALITGVTGQDGAYLSRLLLKNDYRVVGLTRNRSNAAQHGLRYLEIEKKVQLLECDLIDFAQLISIVKKVQPTEIYNLAAQSSVSQSFNQPLETIKFNTVSVLNLLEAVRLINPEIKFYQASSGEIFCSESALPVDENTLISPVSPYGVSKASAYWTTKNYRESYNLFACSGFLFNHESFLRSENFFVKKVIKQSIKIKNNQAEFLEVGNIDIKRDFGWTPKYVESMLLMLQQETPADFVISSGCSISLRSIIEFVFDYLEIPIDRLKISEKLYRPTEITDIYGNNMKARKTLRWDYDQSFYDILKILIDEEINYFNQGQE